MKRHNFLITGIIILFLLTALPASADMQTVHFTGTVTGFSEAAGTNFTGIGDTWTGWATFDDVRTTQDQAIRRNPYQDGLDMLINDFGWGNLTADLDESYPDYPEMVFLMDTDECVSMRYEYYNGEYFFTIGGTNLGNMEWKISEFSGASDALVSGDIAINQVPIPETIWLLGTGLFGLVGLRKRNARS